MDMCAAVPSGAGFIRSVSTYLDCQAQTLGSAPWTALAAPGSTLSIILTGFMTLFVALAGFRLLLGGTLTVRSATLAFVKIGAVLALATSWPAYRTLVYDLVVDGPPQLVSQIGPSARVPGSDGTLLERLDLADRSLSQLVVLGSGPASVNDQAVPPPFVGFDEFALGTSRILFLLTALASISAVHIVAAVILALGPFFIAFVMFDSTRGFFEGWVRVLTGSALAAFGVSISLGLELAFLQPWLTELIALRTSGGGLPAMPSELLVLVSLFAIVTLAVLKATVRVASGFRWSSVTQIIAPAVRSAPVHPVVAAPPAKDRSIASVEPSRASSVASAVAALTRREAAATESRLVEHARRRPSVSDRRGAAPAQFVPAGRTFTHSSKPRSSARGNRRDSGR